MKQCKNCDNYASPTAKICPKCGAGQFRNTTENHQETEVQSSHGWEYKSKLAIGSLPLLHISFKYGSNGMPVVAKGIVAIGQFAIGVVNVSQFGIGLFSLSQFTIAGFAVAQFALAYSCIAQIGLCLSEGWGQQVFSLGLFQ